MWDHLTIWNSVALLIAAAGLALLAWALLADRAKGRLRCPKCWYSLDGTPADDVGLRKCPECGRGNLRERSLKRTRRRRRYALLALLVLIFADQSRRIPAANQHGWVAFVPSTLIIPLAPFQASRLAQDALTSVPMDSNWQWLDTLSEEMFRRDRNDERWMWQANAWAIAASFAPLADDKFIAASYDMSLFIERPPPEPPDPPIEETGFVSTFWPTFQESQQDALNVWMNCVAFEHWRYNGGANAMAEVFGSRVLVIGTPGIVQECDDFHKQIVHPTNELVSWSTSEFGDTKNWVRQIIRFDPSEYTAGGILFESKFVQAVIEHLMSSTSPEQWWDNGGEGIMVRYLPGRIILQGKQELVTAAVQNLAPSIEAMKRELDE